MSQNLIYQVFNFDLEATVKSAEQHSVNLLEAARTLRTELSGRGYIVLESMELLGGLPSSMVLGGDMQSRNHKQDFAEVASRFNLQYRSGECYHSMKVQSPK